MKASSVDWSNLNEDMVELIGDNLDSCTDYVRFRAVCFGWRSFLPENPPMLLLRRRFPYLLLPPNSSSRDCSLFSSFDLSGEVVDLVQLSPRPGGKGRGDEFCYRGFTQGWLIAIEKEGPSIYLINPFTGDQKLLPPVNTFPEVYQYHPDRAGEELVLRHNPTTRVRVCSYAHVYKFLVQKIVLSSPPTGAYIAVAICGEFSGLAYCRDGGDRWTLITGEETETSLYQDIIFHKDKFYAVDACGGVLTLNFNTLDCSPPSIMQLAMPPCPTVQDCDKLYLVGMEISSCNHYLLLVSGYVDYPNEDDDTDYYETIDFMILKLDLNFDNVNYGKWSEEEPENLDNHILFVGMNESLSFPSHNFPGCNGDLIYFTDDYVLGRRSRVRGSDIGVFNLANGTIERLQAFKPRKPVWPPPIWVMRQNP